MIDKTNYSLEEIRRDLDELGNKILDLYLQRKTQKYICAELNITRGKIDTLVKKYKLTRFRERSRFMLNEDAININNPEFCYFLGVFASDGNLHYTGGSDVIQFTQKDKQLEEDLIKILSFTGTIKEYKKEKGTYYYLQIINKKLTACIKELFNGGYRKTSTLKMPKLPNKDCYSMFFRGFWDGDGCFSKQNPKSGRYMAEMYCDSPEFLIEWKNILDKYNINSHISKDTKRFAISAKLDVLKFMEFIYSYPSTVGLQRKRVLYEKHKETVLNN